ncbi:MAG: hypothetical protein IJM85_05195 [Clostridia bacterium]|nr:hypothetical protein [Clostridia bacterium]
MSVILIVLISVLVKTLFWSSRGLKIAREKLIAILAAVAVASAGILLLYFLPMESFYMMFIIPAVVFIVACVLEYVIMGLAFGFREFPFFYSVLSNLLASLLLLLVFLLACVAGLL